MKVKYKRHSKKKSSITRRDLIKTAVVTALASSASSMSSSGQD